MLPPPSYTQVKEYIRGYVDNSDSISMTKLYEDIHYRFPTLRKRKYSIKSLAELQIMQKVLGDDSDDEPLTKKQKKQLPSEKAIKEFVIGLLQKADLEKTTMNSIFQSVCIKFQSSILHHEHLIRTLVATHLNIRPSEDSAENMPQCPVPTEDQTKSEHSKDGCLLKEPAENLPEFVETTEHKTEKTELLRIVSMKHYLQQLKDYSQELQIASVLLLIKIQLVQIGDTMIANYYDTMGYVYSRRRSQISRNLYLRCKNSVMHKCKASVVVRFDNFQEATLLRRHNHESVRLDLDRVKFNKKLEIICKQNPFIAPQVAYQTAKLQLEDEIIMKNIPSLKSFEALIFRLQKTDIPLLPKTVDELESLILDIQYGKNYSHDLKGTAFYRGVWRGPTGANVAFVSECVLQQLRKERHLELLMDGTFKVLPLHIKFRQLYIINVIIQKRSYPLAYILMERKDTVSYEFVFNEIKNLMSSTFRSIKCMTDYEAATRKALKKVFPEAEIYGCFFHYVQAITKRFKKFGLSKNKDKFNTTMQQVCALALLPNEYILTGFDYIAKSYKKSKSFARFEQYWRKQWAKANISVYGLENRTNNFAETLNRTINTLIGSKHPHVWRLIHNLRFVERDRGDELERVLDFERIPERKKDKAMSKLNEKIMWATKLFEKELSVKNFLGRMACKEDFQMKFKERIHIDGVDEGEELFDEDDDEVIPNDFRKSCSIH